MSGASGWAFVNSSVKYTNTSGTSLAMDASSLTSGNHIFLYVRYEGSTTTVSASDTAGNTYTSLTETTATGLVIGRWFYCLSAAGNGSNVVTVSWSSARSFRWAATMQFSKTSASFDTEANGSATASTSVTSSSFNTASAGLLVAGRGAYNQQNDPAATSFSDSMIKPLTSDNLNFGSIAYLITSGPLTGETITETGSSSTNRCLQIASFV